MPQRSVATLADTGVVAQRAADGTDRGAGCQVFVQGLRDDGTGNGTACGALRVGRDAAALIAGGASRKTGGNQGQAGNAEARRISA
ncbi:hypothetical protein [Paracoccus sp. NBH48]|uniref:hypothetical protein n=1 Tax=Paracoccus sp. NBH48 TaxID=2596918 RepID=UPI0018916110|nr:hypothetical protein [Paracoccus sp. NBH48]